MVPDDEVQYVEVKAIGVQEVSCKEVARIKRFEGDARGGWCGE